MGNKDVTASAAKGVAAAAGRPTMRARVTLGYLLTAAGLGHMCLGALLFFNASMMQTGNLLFVPGESRPRAGRTPWSVILPPTHKKIACLIDTHYLLFNLLHTNTTTIITTITTIHNQRAL